MRVVTLATVACTALAPADGTWSTATPIPERIQEMHAAVLHGKF